MRIDDWSSKANKKAYGNQNIRCETMESVDVDYSQFG